MIFRTQMISMEEVKQWEYSSPHCTLRTSIIGPELKDGTGLFHWFMKQEGEVKGYINAYWVVSQLMS